MHYYVKNAVWRYLSQQVNKSNNKEMQSDILDYSETEFTFHFYEETQVSGLKEEIERVMNLISREVIKEMDDFA